MRIPFAIAALLAIGALGRPSAHAQAGEGAAPASAEGDSTATEEADSEAADAGTEPEAEAEPAATVPPEADPPAPEPEPEPQGGDELPPEMRSPVVDDTEPVRVQADEPARPMRIVGRLGVGGSLRLVTHDELQQDLLGPSYSNLQGAFVLPLAGALRHSVLVGATTNLESDGSFVSGVDPFEQWVVEVGYGVHVGFGRPGAPTWLVGGHVSGALVLSPAVTWGFEVGGDAAYHFLAGLGVYAEVNVGTYFGAEDRFGNLTVNPLLSLEVGLTWDYEVLP